MPDLLLEVYLAMTGGQGALTLGRPRDCASRLGDSRCSRAVRPAGCWLVRRATHDELLRTSNCCVVLDKASRGKTAWRKLRRARMRQRDAARRACRRLGVRLQPA